MKNIFLVFAVMLFAYSATAQNTNKILRDYIVIKDALVSSNSKEANSAIKTFYQTLKNEKDFTQKTTLFKATEKLLKATSLEKQRSNFNEVSTIMWKLIKSSDNVDKTVYYQYCPMKKAYWLSYEKGIKNPYYGSSMLSCGKVNETKN